MLSTFWVLRRWGVRVNQFKNKNLRQNIFQIMLNEVLKSCKKMLSADIKTDAKQNIKELVAASYNFSQNYLLKT